MSIMFQRYPRILSTFACLALGGLPFVVGAQIDFENTSGAWRSIFETLRTIIGYTIPVLFAAGLLIFLWGLLRFLRAAGDETALVEGRRFMVWGVIILFVMTAVWGLVGIVSQFTGIDPGTVPVIPGLPTPL